MNSSELFVWLSTSNPQEELGEGEAYTRQLEDALDAKTAELIAARKVRVCFSLFFLGRLGLVSWMRVFF